MGEERQPARPLALDADHMLLLVASEATVPFISFFFDVPESPDRCPLMGPPRKLPASVPSALLLVVRDGAVGRVEEVDALAAIRFVLPWKGPCPVLKQASSAAGLGTGSSE